MFPINFNLQTTYKYYPTAFGSSAWIWECSLVLRLGPIACSVIGRRPSTSYLDTRAEFLHSYWTTHISTKKEAVFILYMILRARFWDCIKLNYNLPQGEMALRYLFLYLECRGTSFSLNTLENHTKKIIQKQKSRTQDEIFTC